MNSFSIREISELVARFWLWAVVIVIGATAFFGAPGDYTGTSHAILHGLCAQTPSHTLMFGDRMLPFDSRMTGIYGGFLITFVTIMSRSKLFHYGNPPVRIIVALAALVGAMAVDGFNSLLTDLGLWHPYQPVNALRVVTGYGVGVALAIALCWLLASSVWNMSKPTAAIRSFRDLFVPTVGLIGYGAILVVRPTWMHFPVSMLLVVSAWITVSMLMLVIVLLALRLDDTIKQPRQLHVPVAISSLLAVSAMMGLAGGRFWVEHSFGITNAMM
jgi:uncharacterized membrane protein